MKPVLSADDIVNLLIERAAECVIDVEEVEEDAMFWGREEDLSQQLRAQHAALRAILFHIFRAQTRNTKRQVEDLIENKVKEMRPRPKTNF